MIRTMIDTTHDGFQAALDRAIRTPVDILALYDTGSADIAATGADIAQIPKNIPLVMIDQGFTGSPNPNANVRDCENGAWTLANAVNRTGWDVERPTLYLGYPDTMQQAHDLGWRGDVWIVNPAVSAPIVPPQAPQGINIVAEQWDFSNPDYDRSVIFDPTWPAKGTLMTPPAAQVPPGQWNDPHAWTWAGTVILAGMGLDSKWHVWKFEQSTGKWTHIFFA